MPKKEFEALEKAILHGDAMDAQILLVAKRFPKIFHMGMLPDFKITSQKKRRQVRPLRRSSKQSRLNGIQNSTCSSADYTRTGSSSKTLGLALMPLRTS